MSGVDFDIDRGVAYLTIKRPEVRNALSTEARSTMIDRLKSIQNDDDVVAVVIRGSDGEFCSGGDMAELREYDFSADGLAALIDSWRELFDTMMSIGKPTIAQVEGHALAGGFNMLLHTDIVIAADDARFGVPELEVGMVDPFATTVLAHHVGLHHTLDMVLTGRLVTGREAQRIGLVSRSVPADRLDEEIDRIVESLGAVSQALLERTKTVTYAGVEMSPTAASVHAERVAVREAREGDAYPEGFKAFLEDRDPEW